MGLTIWDKILPLIDFCMENLGFVAIIVILQICLFNVRKSQFDEDWFATPFSNQKNIVPFKKRDLIIFSLVGIALKELYLGVCSYGYRFSDDISFWQNIIFFLCICLWVLLDKRIK